MTDIDLIRPVKTTQINDDFAAHVKRGAFTPGLDYNCKVGELVWASEKGVVIAASNNPNSGAGKNVTIRHANGTQTIYFHLSEVKVRWMQRVKQGQVIGKTGNTGTQTTGPHLHFAVKNKQGTFLDPAKIFRKEKVERQASMLPTHGIIPD